MSVAWYKLRAETPILPQLGAIVDTAIGKGLDLGEIHVAENLWALASRELKALSPEERTAADSIAPIPRRMHVGNTRESYGARSPTIIMQWKGMPIFPQVELPDWYAVPILRVAASMLNLEDRWHGQDFDVDGIR